MKRLLALVAALVLVGGALVVRSRVIDKKSSSSDGAPAKAVFTVGCEPELITVCEAAAGGKLKVLAVPVDLANAAAMAPKLDAWVSLADAAGMVNAATGSSSSELYQFGVPIGHARLAALTTADRATALRRSCGAATLTWACLVRSAGRSWSSVAPSSPQLQGTVKVGVGDPASILGTVLTGPLALATARGSDPGIDDIDTKAVAQVVASVDQQPVADEVEALTIQGPAAFSVVVAPEELATRAAASTRGRGLGLTVLYPDPVARTAVQLAPPTGTHLDLSILSFFTTTKVRAALVDAGWVAETEGRFTGLPAADVLYALRQELTP